MVTDPPTRSEIEDLSVINAEIVITSYFDSEGALKYAVHVTGDPNLAQSLGMCELAKNSIHMMYLNWLENQGKEDGDDDEGN